MSRTSLHPKSSRPPSLLPSGRRMMNDHRRWMASHDTRWYGSRYAWRQNGEGHDDGEGEGGGGGKNESQELPRWRYSTCRHVCYLGRVSADFAFRKSKITTTVKRGNDSNNLERRLEINTWASICYSSTLIPSITEL